jgi:myo-inositol 2-dehydrogenase/D-chiro-inositol 1-dehydrogenase
MSEKLPIALLGAGRMGSIHGRNAAQHPKLELRYIVDTDAALGGALANDLGAKLVSLDDALADKALAGLVIASSTDMHLEHSLIGAKAGKAMFCEKPIDLDLAKARTAASAFGPDVRYVLGFNRRFDPNIRALKTKLDAGAIGGLETLNIINHDPAPPPPAFIPRSGGLFKDFTIHDLDLATWLMGEPISEIFATASCLVDKAIAEAGDVDTAKVILKTATGKLCVISNTRRSGYGYDQRVEAFGAKGMLNVGNVRESTVELWNEAGALAEPIKPNFLTRYGASYAAEMDHFADVATGKARSSVGYDAGLNALILAEAAAASYRANAPVKL